VKQSSLAFDLTEQKAPPLPKADYDYPQNPKDWSRIALIGEAPGAEEARLGHPFVGRSGQLLDKMLQQAGIDRKQCFVGNVFRFQPPGNKVDHFFTSRRAAKAENLPIAENYGQFDNLAMALNALKPRVIMALGRTPLWALTGLNGLLDKVGRSLPCRLMPETQVIPTYHPSFIMRGNWGLQEQWLKHFLGVKQNIAPQQ
jgi:uracil-DNA glycosylase